MVVDIFVKCNWVDTRYTFKHNIESSSSSSSSSGSSSSSTCSSSISSSSSSSSNGSRSSSSRSSSNSNNLVARSLHTTPVPTEAKPSAVHITQ